MEDAGLGSGRNGKMLGQLSWYRTALYKHTDEQIKLFMFGGYD
jgi:hypothetical protein